MLYARSVGLPKNVAYPLNPLSSQAARPCPGKARSYEPKALNGNMLPMRRMKSLTISHTQQRKTPIPTLISIKEKEWRHEKKKETYTRGKKKKKNRRTVK